jgi:hypothetical protein
LRVLGVGSSSLDESLIEEFEVNLLEIGVGVELLNKPLLAAVLRPEGAPLALLLGARDVELPVDIFARLATGGARYCLHGLNAAIRLLTSEADPCSITHSA